MCACVWISADDFDGDGHDADNAEEEETALIIAERLGETEIKKALEQHQGTSK